MVDWSEPDTGRPTVYVSRRNGLVTSLVRRFRDNESRHVCLGFYLNYWRGTKVEKHSTMRSTFWSGSLHPEMENVEGSGRVTGNRLTGEIAGFTRFSSQRWQCQTRIIAKITFRACGSYCAVTLLHTINVSITQHQQYWDRKWDYITKRSGHLAHWSRQYFQGQKQAVCRCASPRLVEMDYNDLYLGNNLGNGHLQCGGLLVGEYLLKDAELLNVRRSIVFATDYRTSPALTDVDRIWLLWFRIDIVWIQEQLPAGMESNGFAIAECLDWRVIRSIWPVSGVRKLHSLQHSEALTLNEFRVLFVSWLADGTYNGKSI